MSKRDVCGTACEVFAAILLHPPAGVCSPDGLFPVKGLAGVSLFSCTGHCVTGGRLESDRSGSSPVVKDDVFNRFERKVLLDYANGFDAWLIRVIAENERRAAPGSYAERLERGVLTIDPGIVYDLARLCVTFIAGDMWGWALLLRRQGTAVDEIIKLVAERAAQTEEATYERKWLVGLGRINTNRFFETAADQAWVREAWTVVVKDSITEFIVDDLRQALIRWSRTTRRRSELGRQTPERARIEKFIVDIRAATGQRIEKQDLWRAACYGERSEFQKFQSGKGSPTAIERFDEILKMTPDRFLHLREIQNRPKIKTY